MGGKKKEMVMRDVLGVNNGDLSMRNLFVYYESIYRMAGCSGDQEGDS